MSARVRLLRLGVAVAATAAFGIGAAAPATAAPGNGANGPCGPYCHVDGQPSENGYGRSNTPHEAGSRGKADNKFPPGQSPDGSDHNNGYECDGNGGVGQKNPAHSGCEEQPPPPPPS